MRKGTLLDLVLLPTIAALFINAAYVSIYGGDSVQETIEVWGSVISAFLAIDAVYTKPPEAATDA